MRKRRDFVEPGRRRLMYALGGASSAPPLRQRETLSRKEGSRDSAHRFFSAVFPSHPLRTPKRFVRVLFAMLQAPTPKTDRDTLRGSGRLS